MALKNLNKENVEKLALKREGHSLIDKIKWRGYSKDTVYIMLAKEMGVEERHAHFSAMNTLRELRRAVDALRILEKKVPKTEHASPTRDRPSLIGPSIKIYRAKAEKPIKIQAPKKTTTDGKSMSHWKKKRLNSLPQSAYAITLREVAERNAQRSTHSIKKIELEPTPQVSWFYKLFKSIWPTGEQK